MEGSHQADEQPYDFPKVELHCHLDGCYRVPTVAEIGRKRGISLPSYDPDVLKGYITCSSPCASLDDFLAKMAIATKVFGGDPDAISRLAREAVEDKARDGVKYVEFRYSPQFLANCDVKELYSEASGTLRPRDVVEVVNTALEKASHDHNITVRTILCTISSFDWSQEVVKLCEEFHGKGVVGFDIAGPEKEYSAHVIQAYEKCVSAGIHRTAHAGEVGPAARVKQAIEKLHVQRVGHGYHVVDDENVFNLAKQSGIHFEVCPLSSHLTSAVKVPWSKHPAKRFLADRVNFGLNTDDPGVNGHGILRDYQIADVDMGFTNEDFYNLNVNAAQSCFLDGAEKQQLVSDIKSQHSCLH